MIFHSSGCNKDIPRLQEIYWWNGMKKYIADFVVTCLDCQQLKVEHQSLGGLTKNTDNPTWKWEDINMEFVVGCHAQQETVTRYGSL